MRVDTKYRQESVKIGNKRTVFTWNGRKKPDVTYVYENQVVPEEGSLDTVIDSLESTNAPLEETKTLKSPATALLYV